MKVTELRSKIKQGIHDGTISVLNKYETRSLSRFRAYLSKSDCESILANNELDVMKYKKALYSSNGVSYSSESEDGNNSDGSSDSSDGSSEGNSEAEAVPEGNSEGKSEGCGGAYEDNDGKCCGGAIHDDEGKFVKDCPECNSDDKSEGSGSGANDVDYEVFTTKGSKTLDDVKADMNIESSKEFKDASMQILDDAQAKLLNKAEDIEEEAIELLTSCKDAVAEAKKSIGETKKVEITLDGKVVTSKDEIYHPKFAEILSYCKLDGNVMLVGGAGTGKTTLAQQVATSLKLEFGGISCTMGMSEAHLLGRVNIKGEYTSTKFIEIYENGGVWLFDEFDALDSNMFCVVNSALANGYLSIPNRTDKPTAYRHKDCIVIACGNTWGNGQGSRQYSGRNLIDGATLDRFTQVEVGYDSKLENVLVGKHKVARKFLDDLRKSCASKNLEKIISTRLYKKANVHFTNKVSFDGKSVLKTFADMITASWSDREKAKVELDSLVASCEKLAKYEKKLISNK